MELTSFSAAAMEATLVTAILVASATLGFLISLMGFRWRRFGARRRGGAEIPHWIVVNQTLQKHLLQGVSHTSCWGGPLASESYPLREQPQQQPDDSSAH